MPSVFNDTDFIAVWVKIFLPYRIGWIHL